MLEISKNKTRADVWERMTQRHLEHTFSKHLIRVLTKERNRDALKLNRTNLKKTMRLLTGHYYLEKHLHIIALTE